MTDWSVIMLDGFLNIDTSSELPLWRQIYDSLASAVCGGSIPPGTRIPSIRELASELGVSRSPVENAYVRLQIDGILESRPKSGFFTLEASGGVLKSYGTVKDGESKALRYDFSSEKIDINCADADVWKRHLRMTLNRQDEIISRGSPMGEAELRDALVAYCRTARGVVASPDRIIIASGTQQLLSLLCRILGHGGRAALEDPGFSQAEQVFADFGWQTDIVRRSDGASLVKSLSESKSDIFAEITSNLPHMPLAKLFARRNELISWARGGHLIVEDDYNGELHYVSRPVPSLQGAAPDFVVYVGSFSRLLLPSVRIAYMVLPPSLAGLASKVISSYDQTSSKVEQLALAEYIKNRDLERHLKRSRKIYQAKAKKLMSDLKEKFETSVPELYETSMSVRLKFKCSCSSSELEELAFSVGIRAEAVYEERGFMNVYLSFSGISSCDITEAVTSLHRVWNGLIEK